MSDLEFIKNTPSDVLYKKHLKVVFSTYYQLFGEVCTGCPTKIAGYIKRIKNHKKSHIMSTEKKSNFKLKERAQIVVRGSSKSYSNANLTDEVAIAYLKKNPNRKVLFAKLPENIDELISSESVITGEKTLEEHSVAELRAAYPEAKGKKKSELIESIQSLINQAVANTESEENETSEEEE